MAEIHLRDLFFSESKENISSWGQNWILTFILVLGTFVCGAFGFFDIKRALKEKDTK
ncbi:hypothetical protein GLW00_06870 [Halobacillus litoralis]|uniref:Uncharacterized protein n=1 Tax=Halobacillus litoralis TaxID=45668 RepID=A0A845F8M8_9BACI|nr:hypothetical protein [Halobacillus litoralis]MYL70563.1 hypothetical protein [Halobacillus litoralis]